MLNQELKQVLDALKKLTGEDGNFKVIEADEIIEEIDDEISKVQLSAIIRDLRDRDYLKVKYLTPEEYCLLTVPKQEEIQQIVEEVAKAAVPAVTVPEIAAVPKQKHQKPVKRIVYFLWSFFGAMLGGGIVTAVAIVLQKYLI